MARVCCALQTPDSAPYSPKIPSYSESCGQPWISILEMGVFVTSITCLEHLLMYLMVRSVLAKFISGLPDKMSGRHSMPCRTIWSPIGHFSQLMTSKYNVLCWTFAWHFPCIEPCRTKCPAMFEPPAGHQQKSARHVRHISRGLSDNLWRRVATCWHMCWCVYKRCERSRGTEAEAPCCCRVFIFHFSAAAWRLSPCTTWPLAVFINTPAHMSARGYSAS